MIAGVMAAGSAGAAYHVRAATPGDVPAIVVLERDHLGPDPWSAGLIEPGVRGELPTVQYLVAELAGEVVAHAVVSAMPEVAELQRIAVHDDARRRGVASALLVAVVAVAIDAGAARLLLEVREANVPALAFYAARDFHELHRRRRYYRDGSTAVVLERDLAPQPARSTTPAPAATPAR